MADASTPSPTAIIISTAIIAGLSGYMIGIASSLGFLPIPFQSRPPKARGIDNYDDEEESEEEDIDESILDHAPNWGNGIEADRRDGLRAEPQKGKARGAAAKEPSWEDNGEECKLVLVVRTDLGMTKGMFPKDYHSSISNDWQQAKSQLSVDMPPWLATRII
jgi:PTH2 family peptidyl-tRNA hydrolase